MSRYYAFRQEDIIPKNTSEEEGNLIWDRFYLTAKLLGFNVRVTGNNDLSHDILGTKDDFDTIKSLSESVPLQKPKPWEIDNGRWVERIKEEMKVRPGESQVEYKIRINSKY